MSSFIHIFLEAGLEQQGSCREMSLTTKRRALHADHLKQSDKVTDMKIVARAGESGVTS
ncbi:hypothetical protein BDW74DRAFT_153096 [Aspergillus multicolor]|uniref:uncharacterized protein n=1 Tax=Aspergillus multicolor TaxID=41759 RepID=UPI003CCE3BC3